MPAMSEMDSYIAPLLGGGRPGVGVGGGGGKVGTGRGRYSASVTEGDLPPTVPLTVGWRGGTGCLTGVG